MKCSPTFANPRGLGEIFASIGVMSVMWLCWTWHSLLILMMSATITPYPNEATTWQMRWERTLSHLHARMWWQHTLTQISHLVMTMCPRPYHHHNATVMMIFWSCPPPHPQALPVYNAMSWWQQWCALGHLGHTTTTAWHHYCSPTTMWSPCHHSSVSHDDVDMPWAVLPPLQDDDDDATTVMSPPPPPPPPLHPHINNDDNWTVALSMSPKQWQ